MTTMFDAIADAQAQIPVDVNNLANRLGIPVVQKLMPDEMSGSLVKTGDESYEIHVNALHPSTRQRFTIAHELGHYVNHRSLLGDGVNDNKAYRTTTDDALYNPKIGSKQETEANRFAASLLMPAETVEQFVNSGMSVKQMSEKLGVSKHAMSIRAGVPYED